MADLTHWSEDPRELDRFVEHAKSSSMARLNLDRVLLRLYHGRPIALPAMDVRRPSASVTEIENMKAGGFNLARQVTDAAAALVVRMPAVKVLPVGQQFKRQRGAKLMSRYLNGVFYDCRAKTMAPSLFVDASSTRGGALKFYVDKKARKVKAERLNTLWLFWDDNEGPNPNSLYYEFPASKRYLKGAYPKFASDIDRAPPWEPLQVPMVGFQSPHKDDTRVRVVEAWCLPQGDKPGRHVIQLMAGKFAVNLVDEKWEFTRFPVALYRWADGANSQGGGSYGGKPLLEVIFNHHLWFNKIHRIMGEASNAAVPKMILHELAESKAFSDKVMETIRWRGNVAPTVVVPNTIGIDLKYLRDLIKADAYELAGVNQNIAQGATSDALRSAPAQRERMDIASTRLIHPTERFEGFWRECAEVVVMLSAKTKNLAATSRQGSYLSEIPFEDIQLAEDEYAVEVQSTAALPLTVGGRLDFVNDLLQMKGDDGAPLIRAKDGLRMLQIPDTDSVLDRETAAEDLALHQIEEALWEGNYIPPEPFPELLDNLLANAPKELMRALQNGTFPEENLELCRRLIAEAKLLQKGPANQQAAAQAPQPQMPPPGPGAPAPIGAPPAGPGQPMAAA